MVLTEDEKSRYARQLQLESFGLEGQERLKLSKVLIVGAGGLGCPIAKYLVGAGVGEIGLVDHDTVDVSNLPRQLLYSEKDSGRFKVDCAKEHLQQHNPHVEIAVYPFSFDLSTLELIDDYHLIIDGSDQLDLRYLLNAACRKKQKPYLFGGVSTWKGIAGLFYPDNGPCYQCLFPEKPAAEVFPQCVNAGVLGILPGIIGTLQASLAISYLSFLQLPVLGEIHQFDLQRMDFRKFRLERNPNCPICKGDYSLLQEDRSELSAQQLKKLMNEVPELQIIDVREEEELSFGMIRKSLHLPLWDLSSNLSLLSKNTPVVCYCQKGVRSKRALEILIDNGFEAAFHLKGGWEAWQLSVE